VRLAGAYLTVAVASGCTLVLELVAGRILAPFVGVSIQTWTSVVAVVLAGISLGNYVGGVLADRTRSDRVLGALLVAGGLASLAVLPLTAGAITLAPRSLPFVARIVLLTTLMFFVPCLVLGTIPPVAIKRALTGLERSGKVVGRMYAASTAGSLVGAFLTGFVLIAYFGTRTIILCVSLTLIGLGAVAVALGRDAAPRAAAEA
jgi:predicted MFS family arabinose efflux permease